MEIKNLSLAIMKFEPSDLVTFIVLLFILPFPFLEIMIDLLISNILVFLKRRH